MSGYDIKKFIEIGLSHFWNESYGQLFPTLNRLVEEGLATKEEDAGTGRRKRFLFSITEPGREALFSWLREPSEPVKTRSELTLKFFLSCRQPPAESMRLLAEHRAQIQTRLEDYTQSERVLAAAVTTGTLPEEVEPLLKTAAEADDVDRSREALMFFLTLRQGILVLQARLDWCDEATTALDLQTHKPPGAKQ